MDDYIDPIDQAEFEDWLRDQMDTLRKEMLEKGERK